MARHLGRPLDTAEVVRHINGKKHDNRIENLALGTAFDNKIDQVRAVAYMENWRYIAYTLMQMLSRAKM